MGSPPSGCCVLAATALSGLLACQAAPDGDAASLSSSSARPPDSAAPAGSTATSSAAAAASAKAADKPCEPSCHSIELCQDGACVPACPDGEVYVPATGTDGFVLGGGLPNRQAAWAHKVILSKPFCMDSTEVTVAAYEKCVDAGACEAARTWGVWINYPKKRDHPVNKVHWNHGKTYCEWRKQSLPSEAQWEWAATGGDGRKWPWGDDMPGCEHADFTPGNVSGPSSNDGCHGGGTSAVGTHPKGDRIWPAGRIHDLSGNVWEWCLDNHVAYEPGEKTDPVHMSLPNGARIVRGGGWNRSGRGIRVDYRGGARVDYQVPGLGFRCVRNPS